MFYVREIMNTFTYSYFKKQINCLFKKLENISKYKNNVR